MSELIERLQNEADLCRNDGADDIAKLLNEAIERIKELEIAIRWYRVTQAEEAMS